jgi:hypothetical protein
MVASRSGGAPACFFVVGILVIISAAENYFDRHRGKPLLGCLYVVR